MAGVPWWIIMEFLPIDKAGGPLYHECIRRLDLSRTSLSRPVAAGGPQLVGCTERQSDEIAYFLHRVSHGNIFARPIDDRWKNSYGLISQDARDCLYLRMFDGEVRDWNTGISVPPQIDAAVRELLDLPVELSLVSRARWPCGMPVLIDFDMNSWWPDGVLESATLHWRIRGTNIEGVVKDNLVYAEVSDLPEGDMILDCEVKVGRRFGIDEHIQPTNQVVHQSLHLTIGGTPDEALPAVTSEQIGLAPADVHVYLDSRTGEPVVDARALENRGVEDVAFGINAEVLQDGAVIGRWSLGWRGAEGPRSTFWRLGRVGVSAQEYAVLGGLAALAFPPRNTPS